VQLRKKRIPTKWPKPTKLLPISDGKRDIRNVFAIGFKWLSPGQFIEFKTYSFVLESPDQGRTRWPRKNLRGPSRT
jgi:hypothetical protein